MSTAEEILDAFRDAPESFDPIIGQPADNELVRLRRFITNILQGFRFGSTRASMSGLVDSDASYKCRFNHAFDRLSTDLEVYDPLINVNAKPFA
mmetsp:Transcript_27655/g.81302  ORF Transcript_27655/g.81302 Transcript_27655/m.81302 type:complete len:94 (+) Transcript_27655:613-894(+)